VIVSRAGVSRWSSQSHLWPALGLWHKHDDLKLLIRRRSCQTVSCESEIKVVRHGVLQDPEDLKHPRHGRFQGQFSESLLNVDPGCFAERPNTNLKIGQQLEIFRRVETR
jgi:hypothetical protein